MSESYATRQELFGVPAARRYKDVVIDGFGRFRLRSLTPLEANSYQVAQLDKQGQFSRRNAIQTTCRLVALCCVDAEGNRLFTDEDIPPLMELDAKHINLLYEECRAHAGLTAEDADVEGAEKNSAGTRG